MMGFQRLEKKGLANFFADAGLAEDRLHLHISELGPGLRPHPPHQHGGVEGLYIFAGAGTMEIDDERQPVGPNEAIIFDATRLHGLVNTGDAPMRYLVILVREP